MTHWILLGALVTGAAGCMHGAGVRPHDTSAAGHDRNAEEHAHMAEMHGGQHEPGATIEQLQCGPDGARVRGIGRDICWTSVTNPTDAHRRAAQEHGRQAAAHRAASADLRQAEARACAGIPERDRDTSPFEHPEDILSVRPLVLFEGDARASLPNERTIGALVTFRAVPGMTAEWLQRVIDCHLARNAALGHQVPEMPDCPLVPYGVQAQVSSARGGFAVAIRSSDPRTAQEILARARRAAARHPSGEGGR